jgi:hypothetical protein
MKLVPIIFGTTIFRNVTNPFSHPTIDEAPSMEIDISFSFFNYLVFFRLIMVSYSEIGGPKHFNPR